MQMMKALKAGGGPGVGGGLLTEGAPASAGGLEGRKYKTVKVLGQGSFGKALLVEEVDTGKLCVVKQISLSKMSPKDVEETQQEASLLSTLNHPNIVAYIDSYLRPAPPRGSNLFIVMEYADSGDLHNMIKRRQGLRWSESTVLDLFLQICLALKHLHDRKVVHRDLKPQNVFVTSSGILKLGDLGIAKVMRGTEQFARTKVGTPLYMSPEVLMDRVYNYKADMWSLGCILYELATLDSAFQARDMRQLFRRICRAEVPPLPEPYSQDLQELVASLLAKDPSKRPSTNTVLTLGFVRERISGFLSEHQIEKEFSHTVLHGQHLADQPNVVRQPKQQALPPSRDRAAGGLLRRDDAQRAVPPSRAVPASRMQWKAPVPRQAQGPSKAGQAQEGRRPLSRFELKLQAAARPLAAKQESKPTVTPSKAPLPSSRSPRRQQGGGLLPEGAKRFAPPPSSSSSGADDSQASTPRRAAPLAPSSPVKQRSPPEQQAPPPPSTPQGSAQAEPSSAVVPGAAPSAVPQPARAARQRLGNDYAKKLEAQMRDLQQQMKALGLEGRGAGGAQARKPDLVVPVDPQRPPEQAAAGEGGREEAAEPDAVVQAADEPKKKTPVATTPDNNVKGARPKATTPRSVSKAKKGDSPRNEAPTSNNSPVKGKRTPRGQQAEEEGEEGSKGDAGDGGEAKRAMRDRQREEMRALIAQRREAGRLQHKSPEGWDGEVQIMVGKIPEHKPHRSPPSFVIADADATTHKSSAEPLGRNAGSGGRFRDAEGGNAVVDEGEARDGADDRMAEEDVEVVYAGEQHILLEEGGEMMGSRGGMEGDEEDEKVEALIRTMAWRQQQQQEELTREEEEEEEEGPGDGGGEEEGEGPLYPAIFEGILQLEEFAACVGDDRARGATVVVEGRRTLAARKTLGTTLREALMGTGAHGGRHGYGHFLQEMQEVLDMGAPQQKVTEDDDANRSEFKAPQLPQHDLVGKEGDDDDEDDNEEENKKWEQISHDLVLARTRMASRESATPSSDDDEKEETRSISMGSEMEAMRVMLEEALGLERLLHVYRLLTVSGTGEERRKEIEVTLGGQLGDILPILRRLIDMEHDFFL